MGAPCAAKITGIFADDRPDVEVEVMGSFLSHAQLVAAASERPPISRSACRRSMFGFSLLNMRPIAAAAIAANRSFLFQMRNNKSQPPTRVKRRSMYPTGPMAPASPTPLMMCSSGASGPKRLEVAADARAKMFYGSCAAQQRACVNASNISGAIEPACTRCTQYTALLSHREEQPHRMPWLRCRTR